MQNHKAILFNFVLWTGYNALVHRTAGNFLATFLYFKSISAYYDYLKPLILRHLCINPIKTPAPNSKNPNLVPIGEGFGFLLYLDYLNFNSKRENTNTCFYFIERENHLIAHNEYLRQIPTISRNRVVICIFNNL